MVRKGRVQVLTRHIHLVVLVRLPGPHARCDGFGGLGVWG